MTDTCLTLFAFDFLRITRLEPNGTPSGGPDGSYVTKGMRLGRTVEVEQGRRVGPKRNGDGTICFDFTEDDKVTGVSLTTAFCKPGFELKELLTGGTLYTEQHEGEDLALGYSLPDISAAAPDGVAIEAWIRGVNEDGSHALHPITGKLAWVLYVYPRVRWAEDGEQTFGGDEAPDTVFRGRVQSNPNFIDPYSIGTPVFTGPELQYTLDEDSLPTVECGYQDLLAPAS